MIRVNLNVLLAERGMTASKLSEDTGISKTTLSNLVNNHGKGIQYDTIDTICNYLKVTPNDFFDYIPIDYSLNISVEKLQIDVRSDDYKGSYIHEVIYEFTLYIKVKKNNNERLYELRGQFDFDNISSQYTNIISLKFISEDDKSEFINSFYSELPPAHRRLLDRKIDEFVLDSLYNHINRNHEEKNSNNEKLLTLFKEINIILVLEIDE